MPEIMLFAVYFLLFCFFCFCFFRVSSTGHHIHHQTEEKSRVGKKH